MSDERVELDLLGEQAMVAFGQQLGAALAEGGVVFLAGDLGAGKTTLSRGVLQSFGHCGAVKSPTYTLVEPYQFDGRTVYHFDLYRLADPEELEYVGIRDYFVAGNLCLVEWPMRGQGYLPQPDINLHISVRDKGRRVACEAKSPYGVRVITTLREALKQSSGKVC